MSAPSDERLMRYFDGELDAGDAREVELWLESSPEARLKLLAWDRVGDAVRAIADASTAGSDIADSVMARIAPPARPALAGANARAPRRWIAAVPAIGLALAAAAAVVLYFRSPATPSVGAAASVVRTTPGQGATAFEAAASPMVAVADTESGAAIESVDFGASAGSIFMVPSGQNADDAQTPVVWLMDDAPPDEGRMAPL
ncbi:MAG TPA: hypothetical protein VHC69_04960 [Polyangiaceae bacterium]|nr:hypothetical protein [Polyangiaceae bacterium]